jgi:hypothetical protein
MFGLLPALQKLPDEVLNDTAVAQEVGGPRLTLAIDVVKAKRGGTGWLPFAEANSGRLGGLPPDQVGDILRYLEGPDARTYSRADFEGRFDAMVDPAAGVLALIFRVKFDVPNAIWRPGAKEPESPEAVKARFGPAFVSAIQSVWSGKGSVRPACPLGKVGAWQTRVLVQVVENEAHFTFHIVAEGPGRSWASDKDREGALKETDTESSTEKTARSDPTGKRPVDVTVRHNTAAHEFGHAVGLHHSRCESKDVNCYGTTAEKYQDVMGGGDAVQVIKRSGKVFHDDFVPWEKIGERYGKDMFPGALAAKCNSWSAG